LLESLFLRSIDCLHLVTAVHENFDEIFTYDRHQQKAASAFGLNFRQHQVASLELCSILGETIGFNPLHPPRPLREADQRTCQGTGRK
jgi:hypothetical protein